MSDVATEIYKKYGILAIIVAFILSLSIWGLAHWTASPGTEVSVLWGFVKYTKPSEIVLSKTSDSTSNRDTLKTNAVSDKKNISVRLPQITIETQYDITEKNYQKKLNVVRSHHKLRQLSTLESGAIISDLPFGTYFFVSPIWLSSYYQGIIDSIKSAPAERFRTNNSYFEIHILDGGEKYIVGFLSESDAAQISLLSGEISHSIVVAPIPLGLMTTFAYLPLNRVESAKHRKIQTSQEKEYSVLDMKLK